MSGITKKTMNAGVTIKLPIYSAKTRANVAAAQVNGSRENQFSAYEKPGELRCCRSRRKEKSRKCSRLKPTKEVARLALKVIAAESGGAAIANLARAG